MQNSENVGLAKKLTEREYQVLRLLLRGMNNRQMAVTLDVSLETIKSHMKSIIWKLGATSRTQAAVNAMAAGLQLPLDQEAAMAEYH